MRIDQIAAPAADWPAIRLYVSVYDLQNRPLRGLQASNFVVDERGVPRTDVTVKTFAESQEGMAVLLVLDASGSMRGKPFQDAKRGVISFLSVLGPQDQAALLLLHDEVQLPASFTSRIEDVKGKVEEAEATAKVTLLYDGLAKAVEEVVARGSALPARRVIVAMSDGRDEGSARKLEDVRDLALAANVPIYSVGFTRVGPRHLPNLRRISELTGGLYLDARASTELSEVYARIFEHLKNLYVITFRAQAITGDGQRHALGLKVVMPGGEAEAVRRTFDAPAVSQPDAPTPPAPVTTRRLWPYLLAAALILVGLAVALVLLRRRRAPVGAAMRACAGCGQLLQPEWTACRHCNTVVPSATYGRLVVLNGADKGSTFPLAATMNTIGLGEENQIVLTGNGIARQHAGITISDKQYELRDYGSETGTYVNGSRVTHRLLRDNDVVRVGDVEVVFEMARR